MKGWGGEEWKRRGTGGQVRFNDRVHWLRVKLRGTDLEATDSR